MKWICERCKAINTACCGVCHNCRTAAYVAANIETLKPKVNGADTKRYSERQVINAIKRALEYADNQREAGCQIRDSFGDVPAVTSSHWTAFGVETGLEQFFYELTKKDSQLANGHRNIPYAQQAAKSGE